MKKKPSMTEVAKKAGVSVSTVSRVLNNQLGISTETRNQILAIAKELDLSIPAGKSASQADKTRNIALIAPKTSYPPQYVSASHNTIGILDETSRFNYNMITVLVDEEDMKDALSLPIIKDGKVDGLILVGPQLKSSFILDLHNSGIPLVLIDNTIKGVDIDTVLFDNEESVYNMTRHLIVEHGRSKIAFFSGPQSWISSYERYRGYQRAMKESSLEPLLFKMPDTTIDTGAEIMKKALLDIPGIDAVVAVNDAVAIGCARICKGEGLSVPEDISIVGFDNIQWAEFHDPPLSTIQTFSEEMGRQAVRRLMDLVTRYSKEERIGVQLRVGTRTIIRQSCGCS